MKKRFFCKHFCPVCAQDVFVHKKSGMVADHSRSKRGRVMPRCPMVGLSINVEVGHDAIWAFAEACEAYREAGRRS